jgi:hypothetical protein
MVCPSCTYRELSASFAASAVKTQAKEGQDYSGLIPLRGTIEPSLMGYEEWRNFGEFTFQALR